MIKIHSIETFGTHEGPGIRLVVFMQGCDFRCIYCQNPDTQNMSGKREISALEILDLLKKEAPYFNDGGGITFSGGEPLCQTENLFQICQTIKDNGYDIALDTNGSIFNDSVKKVYDRVDRVLLDVKHIDEKWHKKITGKSNKSVLETARYLEEIKKPMWIRCVLVPGYSDQPEYLHQLGKHFQNYQMIERVEILPYHTLGKYKYDELGWKYKLEDTPAPTGLQIEAAKKILGEYFEKVFIR